MADLKNEKIQQQALESLFAQKRFPEALSLAEKITADFPDSYHINILYIRLLKELNRLSDAQDAARSLMQIYPDNINLLSEMGSICLKLNKFEEAIEYYNKILFLDPFNTAAKNSIDKISSLKKTAETRESKPTDFISYQSEKMIARQDTLPEQLEDIPGEMPDLNFDPAMAETREEMEPPFYYESEAELEPLSLSEPMPESEPEPEYTPEMEPETPEMPELRLEDQTAAETEIEISLEDETPDTVEINEIPESAEMPEMAEMPELMTGPETPEVMEDEEIPEPLHSYEPRETANQDTAKMPEYTPEPVTPDMMDMEDTKDSKDTEEAEAEEPDIMPDIDFMAEEPLPVVEEEPEPDTMPDMDFMAEEPLPVVEEEPEPDTMPDMNFMAEEPQPVVEEEPEPDTMPDMDFMAEEPRPVVEEEPEPDTMPDMDFMAEEPQPVVEEEPEPDTMPDMDFMAEEPQPVEEEPEEKNVQKYESDMEFVTESAAELYMSQGLYEDALEIYKKLYSVQLEERFLLKVKQLTAFTEGKEQINRLTKFLELIMKKGEQIV